MSDDNSTIAVSSILTAPGDVGERSAALLVVGGDVIATIFNLDKDEITVGRSIESDIPLEFAGISREHLLIRAVGNDFSVQDIGSKNGTFVNDRLADMPIVLCKGDLIRLGPVVLKYIPKGDPERLTYDRLNQRIQLDRFTGCYNKSYFNERVELETRACKASAGLLCLIVFDLDHFKSINDGHGHDAGDFVLKELTGLIHANGVRKQDIFARYGGEEFVILLPDTNLDAGIEIAERLRRLVGEHIFIYDDRRLPVTVSIGVAACREDTTSGAELFRHADSALYDAKQTGRNRVCAHRG